MIIFVCVYSNTTPSSGTPCDMKCIIIVYIKVYFTCTFYRLSTATPHTHSEKLLLQTYNIILPQCQTSTPLPRQDSIATRVLEMIDPARLANEIPLCVQGDGNCLFRALSLGLFGNEQYHSHIRLLTAMELVDNRHYYDNQHPSYNDLVCDDQLHHDPYNVLLRSVTTLGSYSEMMIVFAASAALSVAIQSYCHQPRMYCPVSHP